MVYGSLRFLGCPELSHGNLDLGLAGWWGVPGMSWVVPWQLGTTRTWDWQDGVSSGRFPGCPGLSHGNLASGTGRLV